MHTVYYLLVHLGDFSGHVGRHIGGFDPVHGGYGLGRKNLEGIMLLEFGLDKKICVLITLFKRELERKVTFRLR